MSDVELRCASCGTETLATEGSYLPTCGQCGGAREIVKRHDRVLTHEEATVAGYGIRPAGMRVPPAVEVTLTLPPAYGGLLARSPFTSAARRVDPSPGPTPAVKVTL